MKESNKEFLRECALYIRGEVSEIKIHGEKKTVALFATALSESRKFYISLRKNNLKETVTALKNKRTASKALREQTGYVWPL
tara:strand:+ start:783 stop:1028 length:246 start_codon:yes stop_codon:yes gene_type:complete